MRLFEVERVGRRVRYWTAAVIGLAGLVLAGVQAVDAQQAASRLVGTWSGNGAVSFADGQRELISCRAYYTKQSAELGMAFRCASPSYKIEIRSTLDVQGGQVSGDWEERTFNARGNVAGAASSDSLDLKVTGGGFEGEMTVRHSGGVQTVEIDARGLRLKNVSVRLARSN